MSKVLSLWMFNSQLTIPWRFSLLIESKHIKSFEQVGYL